MRSCHFVEAIALGTAMVIGLQAGHLCGQTRRRRCSQSEPSFCPLRQLCTTARTAFPHLWQAAATSALAACHSGGSLAMGMLPNASKASAGKFNGYFGIPSGTPATSAAPNPDSSSWNLHDGGFPHDSGISQYAGISRRLSGIAPSVWGCRSDARVLGDAGILREEEGNNAGMGVKRLGLGEIKSDLLASSDAELQALKLDEGFQQIRAKLELQSLHDSRSPSPLTPESASTITPIFSTLETPLATPLATPVATPLATPVSSPGLATPQVVEEELSAQLRRLTTEFLVAHDNAVAVGYARRGDLARAVGVWTRLVAAGDRDDGGMVATSDKALYNLGLCYEKGLGVAANNEKAREFYGRAAERGNAPAAYNLALLMLQDSCDSPEHRAGAMQLLDAAAKQGLAVAQTELGVLLMERDKDDSTRDTTTAARLFEQAASQNDARAFYCLGVCAERGWGMERDEARAAALYRRAAQSGHADALYNLAAFHESGRAGVAQDKAIALQLYEAARSAGNTEASECIRRLRPETSEQAAKLVGAARTIVSEPATERAKPDPAAKVLSPMSAIPRNPSSSSTLFQRSGSSTTFGLFHRLLSTGEESSSASSGDEGDWGEEGQVGNADWERGYSVEGRLLGAHPFSVLGSTEQNLGESQSLSFGVGGEGINDAKTSSPLRTGFFLGPPSDSEEEEGGDVNPLTSRLSVPWERQLGLTHGDNESSGDFIEFDRSGDSAVGFG